MNKYLIDTNIFLEIFLNQEKADLALKIIEQINLCKKFITDFCVNSIGIILVRNKKFTLLNEFYENLINQNIFTVVRLDYLAIKDILISNVIKYNLDYDDAYQLTAAEIYELDIISFDKDFDKTKKGKVDISKLLKE